MADEQPGHIARGVRDVSKVPLAKELVKDNVGSTVTQQNSKFVVVSQVCTLVHSVVYAQSSLLCVAWCVLVCDIWRRNQPRVGVWMYYLLWSPVVSWGLVYMHTAVAINVSTAQPGGLLQSAVMDASMVGKQLIDQH